jgi:hypothetical protein
MSQLAQGLDRAAAPDAATAKRMLDTIGGRWWCVYIGGPTSRASGWTPELASRALTVLRIGGAVALGRPVAQAIVNSRVRPREGQLALRKGLFGQRRSLISNATTRETIARSMASANGRDMGARTEALLRQFEHSLTVLSMARYGRSTKLESAALDDAFDSGLSALKNLRVAKMWPMRTMRSVMRPAAEVGFTA